VLFHRSTWSTGWYCYLEDLFVDPARRKAGPAAALIEAVYAWPTRAAARGPIGDAGIQRHGALPLRPSSDQGPFVQYRR
jgi:GNAT superfamily N-acetyltransferase